MASTQTIDRCFDALSDRQRRRVLVTLLDHNPQTVDFRASDDSISDEVPDELALQMHHVHLPKLADMGYVEWDRTADSIERGAKFEELRPLLELLDEHSDELPDEWP
jgi:hypothetical protein